MGRLLAPRQRTLARFDEPGHKAIGDKALDARWRLPGSTMFKELQLTFGDWVALGDWFENIAEIKRMLGAHPDSDTVGQVYYAVLVQIRPRNDQERKQAQDEYLGTLFTQHDMDEVNKRYATLKTRNFKHFSNPLVGDTTLSTAEKAKRQREGKPFGAVAEYHADHLEAVKQAATAAQLGEKRWLGEAIAMDGFACHFLTDAFSGSHARTPRSSIKTFWDEKVPDFDTKLVYWLADEVTWVIDTSPRIQWSQGVYGLKEWIGGKLDGPFGVVRKAARESIRLAVPRMSFGDIVGLIVHDWEGAHGSDQHGPLVQVAGQRFRLTGDEGLPPAVTSLKGLDSDAALAGVLRDRRRNDAERTFAAATLAVRASVHDVERAYELAKTGKDTAAVIAALTDRQGLFASERLLPDVVPDAEQPEEDRMPKWNYDTLDALVHDPKIREALPASAKRVGDPFEDTLATLDASPAVKDRLREVVVQPLGSGDVETIVRWLKSIVDYSPDRLEQRFGYRSHGKQDLVELRQGMH